MHSGIPVPSTDTEVVVRREGVGILLNKRAANAWIAASEVWPAINSRLVMARLKWVQQRQQTFQESFVLIVCAYAPTVRAPPDVWSKFLEDLQDNQYRINVMSHSRVIHPRANGKTCTSSSVL